jgi:hypothetical protein
MQFKLANTCARIDIDFGKFQLRITQGEVLEERSDLLAGAAPKRRNLIIIAAKTVNI